MMWFNILFIVIVLILIVFLLDYIKNVYKTEILLEQLFDQFLRLETRATYAEQEMYETLGKTISKAFFCSNFLLYIKAREKFLLKYQAMPHPQWRTLIRRNLSLQEEPALLGRELSRGILSNGYYLTYFRRKAFRTIVLPIKNNNDKVIGFLIFFYFSLIAYIRALKYLKLNAPKLHDFLKHLFMIMREYAMDFKDITINQIKDYAILITDPNYHITYTNSGALFLLGEYNENKLKSKSFLSYIDTQSLDHFHTILNTIQTLGEIKTHLHLIPHHHKQSIHTQAYLKAITLEDEFMGLYILLHDITNEEIMIQNMKRLSAIANSLFTHSDDAIIQVAPDGRIIRINQAAQKLCGAEIPLVGQPFADLFPSELQNQLDQLLDETKTNKTFKEKTEIQFQKQWYNIRTFPVFVEDQYDSSVISFVDITNIKLHEQKLATITKQMIADLNAARTLQYELLPSAMPSSDIICYQHVFQPCEEFGGDFYYVEEISLNGQTYHLILVADVAGHGISAAMLTVLVKDVYTIFRDSLTSPKNLLPNRFLEILNERLANLEMSTMPFVAAYMGIFCLETREFLYSCGGIPFAIRIHPDNEISFLGIEKSPPTGFQSGFTYHYQRITLQKNDRIIIYTDGVEELLSFYNTYLKNIIMENRENSITAIKDIFNQKIEDFYLNNHHAHYRQDDVTIVLMEILS